MENTAEQQPPNFSIRRIEQTSDVAQSGFIAVYIAAFSESPYFESYTEEQVRAEVFQPHVPHLVLVAEQEEEVIGILCAYPVAANLTGILDFLQGQHDIPAPLGNIIYLSELATLSAHRKRGIGKSLMLRAMQLAYANGYSHVAMRTAEFGSGSLRLFESLGATRFSNVQTIDPLSGVASQSPRRIWLHLATAPFAQG
jgi:GNAT superfamily N-acetyltransferase